MLRHPSLHLRDHRPYPVPRQPWAMAMNWHNLAFLHWRVDADRLRSLIPGSLELDLYECQAWLGVVPFLMTGVRPRGVPALPSVVREPNPSRFLELNVRTYVRVGGTPGVWFFSLDAASKTAVRLARRFFFLPYFDARMQMREAPGGWVDYQSRRTHAGAPPAELDVRFRPIPGSSPCPAASGTLEHFLTERYCLYTVDHKERVLRVDIHHRPWPLQPAEVQLARLEMTRLLGFDLPDAAPLGHFARRIEVIAWRPHGNQVANSSVSPVPP